MAAIAGLIVAMSAQPCAAQRWNQPVGGSPQATPRVQPQPWDSSLSGDTRYSSSSEARSMSPPHWGNDDPSLWSASLPRDLDVGDDPVWQGLRGGAPRMDHAHQPGTSGPSQFQPASSSRNSPERYPLEREPESSSGEPALPTLLLPKFEPHPSTLGPSRSWTGLDGSSFQPNPGWGFRPEPTWRSEDYDDGRAFSFEKQQEQHPGLREILATGKWFAVGEYCLLTPKFQNNLAFHQSLSGVEIGHPIDFGYRPAMNLRFGFESRLGPGCELSYFQFDHRSKLAAQTAGGTSPLESSVWMVGPSQWSRLQTLGAGESLRARHDLEVHSLGLNFFKDFKLPRARVSGTLGVRYVSIAQFYAVDHFNAALALESRLQHITDFRGIGPRALVEYYRRIGHTRLELVGGFGGSLLFGNRDQFVANSQEGLNRQTSANDLITVWENQLGLQYVWPLGENRSFQARFGAIHQIWQDGGTGTQPHDDFGFRGLTASLSLNR